MIAQANGENGSGLMRIQAMKARVQFIFGMVQTFIQWKLGQSICIRAQFLEISVVVVIIIIIE